MIDAKFFFTRKKRKQEEGESIFQLKRFSPPIFSYRPSISQRPKIKRWCSPFSLQRGNPEEKRFQTREMSGSGSSSSSNLNSVFYAENYHPIQAGSIDGTDILPHDNAIYRALLCSSAGLCMPTSLPKTKTTHVLFLFGFVLHQISLLRFDFTDDPFGDPKVIGDPYCTVFVGHLSHLTNEETLRKVFFFLGFSTYHSQFFSLIDGSEVLFLFFFLLSIGYE